MHFQWHRLAFHVVGRLAVAGCTPSRDEGCLEMRKMWQQPHMQNEQWGQCEGGACQRAQGEEGRELKGMHGRACMRMLKTICCIAWDAMLWHMHWNMLHGKHG